MYPFERMNSYITRRGNNRAKMEECIMETMQVCKLSTGVCIHVHAHARTYSCMRAHKNTYSQIHTCKNAYTHAQTHQQTNTHACPCHMCVCVHSCVHPPPGRYVIAQNMLLQISGSGLCVGSPPVSFVHKRFT